MIIQVTKEELTAIVEQSVERKLLEIFGDPDEGLELREEVRELLQRQQTAVAAGDCGQPLELVIQRLGLE